jgi:hypothetical protein
MLKKLTMDNLALCREHISFLDVYCSERAKFGLEGSHTRYRDLFDELSQIVIGPSRFGEPLATPILLPNYTLIERTEFYGVNGQNLPDKVLSDVFGAVFMDTEVKLPTPREGETQAPKHLFLKFANHPGQTGLDIQFEFPVEVALEITKNVRDYLPAELIKGVTSYFRQPSLVTQ